jgi:hypothetical protein
MRTTAASGSGEPPGRSYYDAMRILPRSGLLEQAHAADLLQRASPACAGR